MKSFSSFANRTLVEFVEGPTVVPGFQIKPHKEKYMPGGNIKSKEPVPLMSLQDFYSLEMHHGRIKPAPKKNTISDAHVLMEVYDKDMKALPFNPSTNYHGVGTFINDILTKLKNIKVHGTNEGGKVDKEAMTYVLDHVNHIITNENGLKGHLEAYKKLSERTRYSNGSNL